MIQICFPFVFTLFPLSTFQKLFEGVNRFSENNVKKSQIKKCTMLIEQGFMSYLNILIKLGVFKREKL